MLVEIEIANYRGFSDRHPAKFRLAPVFTALVGQNNSGKSSLLRFLYDFRSLFESLLEPNRVLGLTRGEPFGFSPRNSSTEGLFFRGNERAMRVQICATVDASPEAPTHKLEFQYQRSGLMTVRHSVAIGDGEFGPPNSYPDETLNTILAALSQTLYVGAFRNALNFTPVTGFTGSAENPVYFDLRVGRQFVEWWQDCKGGRNRTVNETAYKLSHDIGRIFGLGNLEINATQALNELQVFLDGKSYRLEELGSGLTQFLVVLANAAFRRPAWILIDEPELNLHPALQLDFVTTLASYARIGIVFATHSVGLARSVGERIYALSRGPDHSQRVHLLPSVPSLAEFLGELSFSTHRELGFDTLLLVEGPTDVSAIQELLRRVGKERRVVLLPLGGAGTIHGRSDVQLAEIMRLSSNIVALIDSERMAPGEALAPDRQAFVKNCEHLGIRCHVLERRAIENYMPERAIQIVKGTRYRALV